MAVQVSSRKVLSIEIGASTTRIVEVDFRSPKPKVYNCVTFETPDGAIEDGFIRNREILSVAMKEALGAGGFKNNNVVFSLSSTKIANREVVIPAVPDNKIQGLVNSNAKEYFPVDVTQYVITYSILERIKNENEKGIRLLVLAAPNTLIESYYDFAKMMNFNILALDYVGNSCFNVIKHQVSGAGTSLVVQLNEQSTLINIIRNNTLVLQRTVPYGMNAVVEAAINTGEFGISDRREAVDKLVNVGIINAKLEAGGIDDAALSYMENNDDSYAKQLRELKAKEDITETLSYLVNNVVRVLDYYSAKFPDNKIDRIYLAGVGSRIKGISHLFRNEIFLEVDKFDNIYGIDFQRQIMIDNADKSSYIAAIGAAIAPVEFIPKEQLVVAKQKNQNKLATIVLIVGIVIGLVLAAAGLVMKKSAESKKDDRKDKAEELSYIEGVFEKYQVSLADSNNIQAMYAATLNKNILFSKFLEEFEKKMPSEVTVTEVTLDMERMIISLKVGGDAKDKAAKALLQLKSMDTLGYVDTAGFTVDNSEEEEESVDGEASIIGSLDKQIKMEVTVTFKKLDFNEAVASVLAEKDAVSLQASITDALGKANAKYKEDPSSVIELPADVAMQQEALKQQTQATGATVTN